jgi:hypothetical protein
MNEALTWGLPIVAALALFTLSYTLLPSATRKGDYWMAGVWFVGGVLVLVLRVSYWGVTSNHRFGLRAVVCVVVIGGLAALSIEAFRSIDHKRRRLAETNQQSQRQPPVVRVLYSSTQTIEISTAPGPYNETLNLDNVATMSPLASNHDEIGMLLLESSPLTIDNPPAEGRYKDGSGGTVAFNPGNWPEIQIKMATISGPGTEYLFSRLTSPTHVVQVGERRFQVTLQSIRDKSPKKKKQTLIAYTFGISEAVGSRGETPKGSGGAGLGGRSTHLRLEPEKADDQEKGMSTPVFSTQEPTQSAKLLLILSGFGDVILALIGGTQTKLWVSLVMLLAACGLQILVIVKVQPFRARKWNVLLGFCVVVVLTLLWWGARPDVPTAPVAPVAKTNTPSFLNRQPKTLHDIFVTEYSNFSYVDGDHFMTFKDGSPTLRVGFRVYFDLDAQTRWVAYFVPGSANTYDVCKWFSTHYKDSFAAMDQKVLEKAAPGIRPVDSKNLQFSGSVILYHETKLFAKELDDLTTLYRKNHLTVQFRGPDYQYAVNHPEAPLGPLPSGSVH